MSRLVLDTNSLIQCISRRSHYDVLADLDFPKVDIIKLDEIIQKL